MIHHTALIGEPPEHRDFSGMRWTPAIEDSARIEALVTVDAGTFRSTRIGRRTWLMKKVHVGHDAIIGDDCEIAPLCSVGGEVVIGNNVKVGQGATFRPRVSVGNGARIGMGAVVIDDVPAGETWVGNPAKCLYPAQGGELSIGDTPQEGERVGAVDYNRAVVRIAWWDEQADELEGYKGLRGL